jgi:hypothetical protein
MRSNTGEQGREAEGNCACIPTVPLRHYTRAICTPARAHIALCIPPATLPSTTTPTSRPWWADLQFTIASLSFQSVVRQTDRQHTLCPPCTALKFELHNLRLVVFCTLLTTSHVVRGNKTVQYSTGGRVNQRAMWNSECLP